MNKKTDFFLWTAFLLLLAACQQSDSKQEHTPEQAAPQPVAVTTIRVKTEDIPLSFEYVGQVAGSLEVDVLGRITGIIEQKHFTEGSRVTTDQLLFTLDDALYEAQYQQAIAAIESARAQKLSARARLKQAQRELKRVIPLANQQMLSQNQQDDAASEVDIAQAELAVAEAAIKLAQANLQTARVNLDYTKIKSPIDGIVGRALQNRGALVQTGDGKLLTTLVKTDPVYVNFGIPENEWLGIRKGLNQGLLTLPENSYRVDLLDDKGLSTGHHGTLDFQDYKVDNNTGNFAMRATLDNADGLLSPGQFVRVQLNGVSKNNAMAIPQRAVLDGPGGKYVYIMSAGQQGKTTAMQKNVILGQWVDLDQGRDNYWIISSGLQPGDEVIVDGVARIFFPGMPVQADQSESSNRTAASSNSVQTQ